MQLRSRKNLYDFTRLVVNKAIAARKVPGDALLDFEIPQHGKIDYILLDENDIRKVLKNLDTYRYGIVIRLLAVTGAHAGEILGLCLDVIDFDNRTITIMRTLNLQTNILKQEPKISNSYRTIRLDEDSMQLFRRFYEKVKKEHLDKGNIIMPKEPIFKTKDGKTVRYSTIQDTWASVLEKSGLPHCRIHNVRHSVATILLKQNVPITEVATLLGQDIKTTVGTYAHLTKSATGVNYYN